MYRETLSRGLAHERCGVLQYNGEIKQLADPCAVGGRLRV